MNIKILPSALEDLDSGRKFYDRQRLGLGADFLDSLFADIDSLVRYAGIHRKTFGFFRFLSKRFPYAVYYKVEADLVVIWRVLDCRRDPAWISRQLGKPK